MIELSFFVLCLARMKKIHSDRWKVPFFADFGTTRRYQYTNSPKPANKPVSALVGALFSRWNRVKDRDTPSGPAGLAIFLKISDIAARSL